MPTMRDLLPDQVAQSSTQPGLETGDKSDIRYQKKKPQEKVEPFVLLNH